MARRRLRPGDIQQADTTLMSGLTFNDHLLDNSGLSDTHHRLLLNQLISTGRPW
jgi:hypothetical protein